MCCGGFEWSVLHPSWLRSRKNGRKRECACVRVREVGGGAAEWCVNDADAYSSVLQVAAFGRGGAEGKKIAADKGRLTVSLRITTGRRRSAANVLAVLAILLCVGGSLSGIDLRLVEHDGSLALELLSHALDCEMRWL